jgi:hypothetical protein
MLLQMTIHKKSFSWAISFSSKTKITQSKEERMIKVAYLGNKEYDNVKLPQPY